MSFLFNTCAKNRAKAMAFNDRKKSSLPDIQGVNTYSGYKYLNDEDPLHTFNLYTPIKENKNYPLIIDFHGGAWIYGDKDLNSHFNKYISQKGYNVLSFGYRLLPKVDLKGMVQDIFHFLHYIEDHKEELHIELNKVMFCGDSAGGHLALITIFINQNKKYQDLFEVTPVNFKISFLCLQHPCPFIEDLFFKDTKLSAFMNKEFLKVLFGEYYNDESIRKILSFNEMVKTIKLPKTLIISGEKDKYQYQIDALRKSFDENQIEYDYKLYSNMKHVFEILNYTLKESKDANDLMLKSFKEALKEKEAKNEN